jgi:stearoyl-CoA desaturase (delta-9 desaturase)
VAAGLWPVYAYFYGVTAGEVTLAVAYFVLSGLSITVGYHRLISHRAFACQPWLKFFFLVFGSAAWQGSALSWSADHIRHHAYTDTGRDPYNIKEGFLYAHVGWLFRRDHPSAVPENLKSDRLLVWQDRWYLPLAIVVSFVVPFLVAGTGGFLLAGAVRLVAGHHATWFVNSWAHVGRKRPYDPGVSAADSWIVSLFTFGEGFHNYHHAFPTDYRNGVNPLAWDPSKWLIWALSLVGVTYDLKRIERVQQWKRRVRSTLEFHSEHREGLRRLRETRVELERQIARTRTRLSHLLERAGEIELASRECLEDLRVRLAQRLHDTTDAIGQASRKRLAAAREAIDHLVAYHALLDQLLGAESGLAAGAPA